MIRRAVESWDKSAEVSSSPVLTGRVPPSPLLPSSFVDGDDAGERFEEKEMRGAVVDAVTKDDEEEEVVAEGGIVMFNRTSKWVLSTAFPAATEPWRQSAASVTQAGTVIDRV